METVSAQLVVSLSGLGHQALDQAAEFAAELDQRGVPLSLLVAPRPGGVERPTPDSPVLSWVRERLRGHDAAVLHGFDHAPEGTRGLLPRLASVTGYPTKALRGAEFAGLPAHEAGLRLVAAQAVLDQLGLRVHAFAPPRWFASPGTLEALRAHGFSVCADAMAIRDLNGGQVYRGRVYGFVPGERVEPWWCRALVLGAGRAARRGGVVRLAMDAADLRRDGPRQAVLDAVDLALHHGAEPATYASYVTRAIPAPRGASPERDLAGTGTARPRNLDPLSS